MAASMRVSFSLHSKSEIIYNYITKRFHRNTKIKYFDIPPDKAKPLPLTDINSLDIDIPLVIPRKKTRDPTALLKALDSTVKKDITRPEYWFVDDPFLVPVTSFAKKKCAVSLAAGRKAAKYMMNILHEDIKVITKSHPKTPCFDPPVKTYKFEQDTEEALLERIERRELSNAYSIYRRMHDNGLDITQSTRLRLLQLLCFYNSDDPRKEEPEELFYLNDWFHRTSVWNYNGGAERVFADMEEKSCEAYSSMIRGRCKYNMSDKGFQLFKEGINKGMHFESEVYEYVIISNRAQNYPELERAIMDILSIYNASGLTPTVGIFSAVFYRLSQFIHTGSKTFAKRMLAEMKRLHIDPTLNIFWCLLHLFYKYDKRSRIFYEILSELEQKEIPIQHPYDIKFFPDAMIVCAETLRDIDAAYRVDNLLGDSGTQCLAALPRLQQKYYKPFFSLICLVETWEKIETFYNTYVPQIFNLYAEDMQNLLNAVEVHDKFEFLPTLYLDAVLYKVYSEPKDFSPLISLMAKKLHNPDLQKEFGKIAAEFNKDHTHVTMYDVELLGNLALLALRAKDLTLAWDYIMNALASSSLPPRETCLLEAVDLCLELRDLDKLMICLHAMDLASYQSLSNISKRVIESSLPLSHSQKKVISKYIEKITD